VAGGGGDGMGNRRVGQGLLKAERRDDLPADPVGVAFAGRGLDDEPQEAETYVRIFEARIRVDDRRPRQLRAQFGFVEKGAPLLPERGVDAVAHHSRTVRKKLGDRRLASRRVEPVHMPADRVVEMQLARLMQPEDPGGREGFRVRSDAEAVPGRERLAGF
jgi:hypothetical protein